MRWPRSNRAGHAIEIKDDLGIGRSDFDEPLPPVTRNELLDRLGLETEKTDAAMSTPSRLTDITVSAAA